MYRNDIADHIVPGNEMNKKLLNLYKSYWGDYLKYIRNNSDIADTEKAQPYLLCTNDDYYNAKVKVLIPGKESNDWGSEFGPHGAENPDGLMRLYDKFVNEDWGSSDSLFWSNFYSDIREWGRDEKDGKIGVLASNVVRISKRGKGYNKEVLSQILKHFNFVKEELRILRPDIIVSPSGKYDDEIKYVFGDFKEEILLKEANLSQLRFTDTDMPIFLRCYHPNAIQSGNYYSQEAKREAMRRIKDIIASCL